MRVLVATDAWTPQINGVVRTLSELRAASQAQGATLSFLTPETFPTLPLPTYGDIRLALPLPGAIERHIRALQPHAIHIATEGPIGMLVRRYCRKHKLPSTRGSRIIFPRGCRFRNPGYGLGCDGFTAAAVRSWPQPPPWRRSSPPAGLQT
jgi:hypothetical protein